MRTCLCSLLGCGGRSTSSSDAARAHFEELSNAGCQHCTGAHGCACGCCRPDSNSAYAYWLFSQGDVVRDYTGSLIVKQVCFCFKGGS